MALEIARLDEAKRATWTCWDKAQMVKCRSCKYLKRCGGLSVRDDSRFCPTQCDPACSVFCCFDDRAVPMLDQLGGAEFTETWKPWDWPTEGGAPDFLWVMKDTCGWKHEPAYVIPLDRLFNGESWSKVKNVRKRFEIPKTSLIGISFFVRDWLVEKLWQDMSGTARRLADYGFDFTFPVNFSTYDNFPRADTLVNLKRRFVAMDMFQAAGLKVIPDVGGCGENAEDAQRMGDWVKANGCHSVFNVDIGRSSEKHFTETYDWLKVVRDIIGPAPKFYLAGYSARRIMDAKKILGNVGVVNSMAAAMGSMKVGLDYTFMRKTGMSAAEVFEHNRTILKDVFYGRRDPPKKGDGVRKRKSEQASNPIEEAEEV